MRTLRVSIYPASLSIDVRPTSFSVRTMETLDMVSNQEVIVHPGKPPCSAYAMELRRSWRVIVPVRGRLTPRICDTRFGSKADALAWMESKEGQDVIFE